MTFLPDGNVLVALAVEDHVHHARARRWFASDDSPFATCPITQGTLLRVAMHHGATTSEARAALAVLVQHRRHRFVGDDVSYADVPLDGVIGHRQVTDAYLVSLAERHDATVVTFDQALAAMHPGRTRLLDGRGDG